MSVDQTAEATTAWQPFDYAAPPEGVCWLEVERPETDGDVDDYGKSVAWHTGKVTRIVVLAEVFPEAHGPEFERVQQTDIGGVRDDDRVVRWMPLKAPELSA